MPYQRKSYFCELTCIRETPRSKQHWGNIHNSMYSCNGTQSNIPSSKYMYTKLKDGVVSDRRKIIQIWYKTLYALYFCVCAYTSRSITLGSSIARLMSIKKVTASRPSISLWSYVKARIIIGRITIWNSKMITTYTCIHKLFQDQSNRGKKSWFKC